MLNLGELKTTLIGRKVKLVQLAEIHRQPLSAIAKDERIWNYYPLEGSKTPAFNAWFDESLEEASRCVTWPYVVIDSASGQIVGTSRYEFIVPEHDRLSVGGTWLDPGAWGKGYNPDLRYLMLEAAFERLAAHRVEVRVDGRNARNLAAWRSFGATEEGTLRQIYRAPDGGRADRVVFSMLREEWPEVREKIEAKLARI